MSRGKKYEAYFALGMAMHALMDSTALGHEGFMPWGKNCWLMPDSSGGKMTDIVINVAVHAIKEIAGANKENVNQAISKIQQLMEKK